SQRGHRGQDPRPPPWHPPTSHCSGKIEKHKQENCKLTPRRGKVKQMGTGLAVCRNRFWRARPFVWFPRGAWEPGNDLPPPSVKHATCQRRVLAGRKPKWR